MYVRKMKISFFQVPFNSIFWSTSAFEGTSGFLNFGFAFTISVFSAEISFWASVVFRVRFDNDFGSASISSDVRSTKGDIAMSDFAETKDSDDVFSRTVPLK